MKHMGKNLFINIVLCFLILLFFQSASHATNPPTTYELSKDGKVVRILGEYGQAIKFDYDSEGKLIKIAYAENMQDSFFYDAANRLQKIMTFDGYSIQYTYDSEGRLASVTFPNKQWFIFRYDKAGNLIQIVYPDGEEVYFEYDSQGTISSIKNNYAVTKYEYDGNGNLLNVAISDGSKASFVYDAHGQLNAIKAKDVFLNEFNTLYKWNENNQIESIVDPLGYTRCQYNNLHNLSKIYSSSGITSFVDWDNKNNRPKFLTAPYGFATYNDKGKISSFISISGVRTIFSWSGDHLQKAINPLWGSINYEYDSGRISKITYPDGMTKIFSWDQKNRLQSISDDLRTISFNRDSGGMLTGLRGPEINMPFSTPKYYLNADQKLIGVKSPLSGLSGNILVSQGNDRFWGRVSSLIEMGGKLPLPSPSEIKNSDQYWGKGEYLNVDPYYQDLKGPFPDLTPENVIKVQVYTTILTALKFARIYDAVGISPDVPCYSEVLGILDRKISSELSKYDAGTIIPRTSKVDDDIKNLAKVTKIIKIIQTIAFPKSEEEQLGGVYIDPTLLKEDSELGNIKIILLKEAVIKSRPSQDSLTWGVQVPKKEETQASSVEERAVSLRVLQERLKACHKKGPCTEASLLQIAGLKRVIGYVVDEANHDLILVGEVDASLPPLYLEDFIVALKNAWMKYAELRGNTYYYSNPGCSIDPDPKVIDRLQTTGQRVLGSSSQSDIESAIQQWNETCRSPQNVRVLGIPFDTRFAGIMVKADYGMKRLVDGADTLDISGFASLTDITLAKAKSDIVQGRSISIPVSSMNRFWFYAGENRYLEDKGVITIERCPVVLLTEEEFLGKRGNIVGKGQPNPLAREFCEDFTAHYAEVAKQRPIYMELENLFRFVAVAKIMKYKDALNNAGIDLDFLLNSIQEPKTAVARQLPGRTNVKGFEHRKEFANGYQINRLWLPSCGGVGMEIKVSQRNFLKDPTGRLAELRTIVLKTRPTPTALFWDYLNQKKSQN